MKFFKNNKALTLAELLVSLAISAALFGIVIFFTMTNVNELANNQAKTNTMQEVISIQDILNNFILSWYDEISVINQDMDAAYSKTNPNPNDILLLYNSDTNSWIMVWVVNIETRKIQKHYVYWENFIWYRNLTEEEFNEINLDKQLLYNKEFQLDKILNKIVIKDFDLQTYNSGKLLDMNISVVKRLKKDLFDVDYNEIFIDDFVIGNYSLVF